MSTKRALLISGGGSWGAFGGGRPGKGRVRFCARQGLLFHQIARVESSLKKGPAKVESTNASHVWNFMCGLLVLPLNIRMLGGFVEANSYL